VIIYDPVNTKYITATGGQRGHKREIEIDLELAIQESPSRGSIYDPVGTKDISCD